MKRWLSLLFTVVLVSAMFLGCSAPKTEDAADGGAPTEEGKKLKIAAIVNGNLGDKSFFDSVDNGMKMISEEYGFETKVIETGYDETKWEPALLDVCEEDWDIIIAGTWQMTDYVAKASKEYPDKKFIMYDTSLDYEKEEFPNVYCIEYKQNEGSFLAGAVAATLSESKNIGFIGGMDIPVINDFLVGYIQGAQQVTPDVKVAISYIGNFSDAAKGKELAFAQYGTGTDLIFSCASTAGNGALEAAKEKGNKAIGVDSDQAMLFKESGDDVMAELIATSVLKRVDVSLKRAIDLDLKGELKWGNREALGIAEDAIGIAQSDIYMKVVPQELQQEIAQLEQQIKEGKIEVQTAFGMDNDALNEVRDAVKP